MAAALNRAGCSRSPGVAHSPIKTPFVSSTQLKNVKLFGSDSPVNGSGSKAIPKKRVN